MTEIAIQGDQPFRPSGRLIADELGGRGDEGFDEYFLASRTLGRRGVVNMLLAASFGANALLYAAWLGYLMGLWALLIQVAWSLSFVLLGTFAAGVGGATSLHDFLGQRFGIATRRSAAICSIVGLAYFIGWEVSVAGTAFEGVQASLPSQGDWWLLSRGGLVIGIAAGVAIAYSALFGRRADARLNGFLNVTKGLLLLGVLVAVLVTAGSGGHHVGGDLFPSFGAAVAAVGVFGLLTSLGFNLAWQFVDNSSWQSLNTRRVADPATTARDLRWAGFWAFMTVNGVGTLVGAMLRGVPGVSPNNILSVFADQGARGWTVLLTLAVIVLVVASVVSLVDGMVLSATQAFVVDLGLAGRRAVRISLREARAIVLIVGVLAAWGVQAWIHALGGSIFNFVYVFIVAQLSLIGPVLVGLARWGDRGSRMWLPIALGFAAGMAAAASGAAFHSAGLTEGAGVLTIAVSTLVAFGLARTRRPHPDKRFGLAQAPQSHP